MKYKYCWRTECYNKTEDAPNDWVCKEHLPREGSVGDGTTTLDMLRNTTPWLSELIDEFKDKIVNLKAGVEEVKTSLEDKFQAISFNEHNDEHQLLVKQIETLNKALKGILKE